MNNELNTSTNWTRLEHVNELDTSGVKLRSDEHTERNTSDLGVRFDQLTEFDTSLNIRYRLLNSAERSSRALQLGSDLSLGGELVGEGMVERSSTSSEKKSDKGTTAAVVLGRKRYGSSRLIGITP